ncbi:MAG: biosynthetic-type acetolactate synthase large subunit [Oscillospiraceae bacterium]|nr:biosynthetic-type acetolactate synthase large subunit [Oscillospiraceae bacterium]
MTGAKAIVTSLEQEGVTTVFGYPGAAICPVYDCLRESPICHILVRQEQNAGHAAAAYGRISGRPGVCIATSGPGALNLLTALATAYMDSVPLVAITGQVPSDQLGRDVFQEADITGAAEPFTKHSFLVKNAADIPRIMKEAFYLASTGRQGPVLIDLPVDIQTQELDFLYPESVSIRGYNPSAKANPLQLRRVVEAIAAARRPVICAGGGVFGAGARAQMRAFAERCRIPVVTTMMGLGLMPSSHPLYFGMLGSFGSSAANYAIRHSDLLILIGTRAGDRAMRQPGVLEKRTRIIHIDIDPAEIRKNMEANIPLVADARLALEDLGENCQAADTGMWLAELKEKLGAGAPFSDCPAFVNPHRLVAALTERLDSDAIYIADVGLNQIWSARSARIKEGRFLTSGGMGTMGYALPAAMGARLATTARQVVAVMGDGGFQMSMQELATLCQHDIPVRMVVLRNDSLGLVRQIQKQEYAGRYEAVDLSGGPDFAALAQVYGIRAMTLSDNDEIDEAVDALLAGEKSFLLQCLVSPDEPAL